MIKKNALRKYLQKRAWSKTITLYNAAPLRRQTPTQSKLSRLWRTTLDKQPGKRMIRVPDLTVTLFNKLSSNLCGHLRRLIRLKKFNQWCEWLLRNKYSLSQNFNWRVWSWLRLNAGGRPNTCKSNGSTGELALWVTSGGRVSNAWGAAQSRGIPAGNGC